MNNSIILQIQNLLVDSNSSVSSALTKAKIVCSKLGITDSIEWIEKELVGYGPNDKVPEYRITHGHLEAFNPYHGWQAVLAEDPTFLRDISIAAIGQSVVSLEEMARDKDKKGQPLLFNLAPERRARLSKSLQFLTDVRLVLPPSIGDEIVHKVRALLLDWTLRMEKAGILGEGLSFTQAEKKKAETTPGIVIQGNVGVIGAIGGAHHNIQITGIELSKVADLAAQVTDALGSIPSDIREAVSAEVEKIKHELEKGQPDTNRLFGFLTSLKSICEQAVGNLTASGVIYAISAILPKA